MQSELFKRFTENRDSSRASYVIRTPTLSPCAFVLTIGRGERFAVSLAGLRGVQLRVRPAQLLRGAGAPQARGPPPDQHQAWRLIGMYYMNYL